LLRIFPPEKLKKINKETKEKYYERQMEEFGQDFKDVRILLRNLLLIDERKEK
jgi:hypothetical protein